MGMTFKSFAESWWFWLLCVSAVLVRGFFRHWDVFTWCLLGFFALTGLLRFLSRRGKEIESEKRNQR
jgi:hypothetical protein